jgi:hypothetical protein
MKIEKPNIEKIAKTPNPGLHAYLDRNQTGYPEDIRTPLWEKAPRDQVVSKWDEIVEKHSDKLFMELLEDEKEQRVKIGRYSMQLPYDQRANDVMEYYIHPLNITDVSAQDQGLIHQALKLVKDSRKKGSIRLRSPRNVVQDMKLSTNSGLPEFKKRRLVVDDTLESIRRGYTARTLADKNSYLDALVAVLGWRGQPIDKQRVVWMMPMILNVLEGMYYKPRIDQIQKDVENPAFISQREVDKKMTKLFDTKGDNLVIATDFTGFDQHFNFVLQWIALELKKYVTNKQDHDDLLNTHYTKFTIPLLCTHDVLIRGWHGMGSGSTGTNQDENEAHEVMQVCAALEHGQILNPNSMRLGDDGVLSYPGINAQDVMATYTRIFNQEMNEDKQYVSKLATKYLQRLYHTKYRDQEGIMLGVYSTYRALGRLLGQERYYDPEEWGPEMVILRSWSIIENCNAHPLFEDFVDFVVSGDKYKLGLNMPGFLDKMGKAKVQDLLNNVTDALSYSVQLALENNPEKGVSEWRIYKYLKTKEEK